MPSHAALNRKVDSTHGRLMTARREMHIRGEGADCAACGFAIVVARLVVRDVVA